MSDSINEYLRDIGIRYCEKDVTDKVTTGEQAHSPNSSVPNLGNLRKRHPRESGDPQALENLDSRFRGNDEETSFRMCSSEKLAKLRAEIGECTRCKLCDGRTQVVFGSGNPNATVMFVGEAPGYDEDQQGLPFVGKAGQLLTRMIEAMKFTRADVYIANVLKCRPPNNRNPEPDEVATCKPFLKSQIEIISPTIIVCLGTFAAQSLLNTTEKISRLRGHFHDYQGVAVMPTYHPAFLLRNPEMKRPVWEDLQKVIQRLSKKN